MSEPAPKGSCPACGRDDVPLDATGSLIQHAVKAAWAFRYPGSMPETCTGGGRSPVRTRL